MRLSEMKIAICNEMFENIDFDYICKYVSENGYKGIEIAPYTFAKDVRFITREDRKKIVATAAKYNLEIVAIHWLLAYPANLSISTPNMKIWRNTLEYFKALVDFANEIGSNILVLGSPNQRNIDPNWNVKESRQRAISLLKEVALYALKLNPNIIIAYEPLSPKVTNLGSTISESLSLIFEVGCMNVKLHIDANAMSSEMCGPDELIDLAGLEQITHVHLNESTLLGPGMKTDNPISGKILKKLISMGYSGWFSVETFDRSVSGENIAKESMEYIKNELEKLEN